MTTEHLIYFIVLALIAEIMGTVGGFGSSIFFVPMAGLFMDFQSVLGVTAVFHLSSNITKIAFFRKGFNKKLILTMGIPAIIFVILGAFLSKYINVKVLEIILGVFLIVISFLFLLLKKISIKPTTGYTIAGGSISGLAAGLVGTGGAIRGLTLAAFGLDKVVFIATSAIIDLGIDLSRSVVYYTNGFLHWHDMYLVLILFVVSIVGTFLGKKILNRFSEKLFRSTSLVLILLIGIGTVVHLIFPQLLKGWMGS
jgi:uncharacterized protein